MKAVLFTLFCVFVCSQHTGASTDQHWTLGQDVTLACELKLKAVIWLVMKPLSRPVMILRTFGSEETDYYDKTFRNKYSEGSRGQLIIKKITVDDLGTYHCVKPGWPLKVSDGIRLDTDVSQEEIARTKLCTTSAPQSINEPEKKHPPQDQKSYQILIVMFTLFIVVLFAAVIGLVMMNRKLSRKIPKYVNGNQIWHRRIMSLPSNSTAAPQNPLTDTDYIEVLPDSVYEIATC